MAPLEPWEKVLISTEEFVPTVHGQMQCTFCHNGVQAEDKETAHEGLIARPSESTAENVCQTCHKDQAATFANSLHSTQGGYWTTIDARSVPEDHFELQEMFGNHCASCHTTCGDCHVSQPASVGGGLIEGHMFNATPSMTRNCTACHGSRVGNEYLGKNEEVRPDVHFRQARMTCVDCHTGAEMHASDAADMAQTHRYEAVGTACADCHPNVVDGSDGVEMHTQHVDDLSCQTCHSASYSSCDNCHLEVSEETGNPFYKTDGTYLTFYIGKNPLLSASRPYTYVPLRHVPIDPNSYSFYTGEALQNYDALPTWVYATPHNIQLETPQNESCEACHGNPDIFLTADKVSEGELDANQSVIVEEIPAIDLIDSGN